VSLVQEQVPAEAEGEPVQVAEAEIQGLSDDEYLKV
jgi:hypothetical protein